MQPPPESDPSSPAPRKAGGDSIRRLFARSPRDNLWAFLDYLDARPILRKAILIGIPCLLAVTSLGFWGYAWWTRSHAILIARQWLDVGRCDRAAPAVEDALATEPGIPDSWRIASELAWRVGNKAISIDYARRAAQVGGYQPDDVLAWAEVAMLSNDDNQFREAWSFLDPVTAGTSARALRLTGESARRRQAFARARRAFEGAAQADIRAGVRSLAIDEVPLGLVCLQTGSEADRKRGQALLADRVADRTWGAEALRGLLADAMAHRDRAAMVRWAEALRAHPRCTLGDIPTCLQALADADSQAYRAALAPIEANMRSNPPQAAQVLGWLTKIGRSGDALAWVPSLDPVMASQPPVAQGVAEALRAAGHWPDLSAWVAAGNWGADLEFLRWAYGMLAARRTGNAALAEEYWKRLSAEGSASPAHALVAGDALVAWGLPHEAATLLWAAADRPDLAYQAAGSLARLYQVQHDAIGQYRAFNRLHDMRPGDRGIANNYAYFAALTDMVGQTHIAGIARDNFTAESGNATYRSTYAFVLVCMGQGSRALALMEAVDPAARRSPPVAFATGAALASLGRKAEAGALFDSLDPRTLDPMEVRWIQRAMR